MIAFKNKIGYKYFINLTLKQKHLSLHKELFLKHIMAHKTLLNWAFTVNCLLPDIFWSDVFFLPGLVFVSVFDFFTFLCAVINLEFQLLGIETLKL